MSDQEPRIGHLRVVEPCEHGRLLSHLSCPGGVPRPTDIDELIEILKRDGWRVSDGGEDRP